MPGDSFDFQASKKTVRKSGLFCVAGKNAYANVSTLLSELVKSIAYFYMGTSSGFYSARIVLEYAALTIPRSTGRIFDRRQPMIAGFKILRGSPMQSIALCGIALFALAACASTPPPPAASLQAARQAISNAEQARATEHAALELSQARDKLSAANNAVENEDMLVAQQLAEESRVLAELAFARAEMADARGVNEEIMRGTQVLKQEMRRDTGGSQ